MLRHRHRVPLVTTSIAVAAAVLLLRWAAHSATTPKTRTVTETTAQPIRLMLKPEGGLSFDVRDAKTGDPIPCKLTLVGVDGTPDPEFTRVDIGRQEGDGAIAAYNRIMSLTGVGVAHVPLGTYDVTVSRGPEWEIYTARKLKITPHGRGRDGAPRARRRHARLAVGRLPRARGAARPTRACRCTTASTSSSPTTCR